jgi:tetratricopeptide (TPR) repeat protein
LSREFAALYTTRDVAKILGLSEGRIRAYVRAGFLQPRRGPREEFRFSVQDLVLLKTARALAHAVPARKLKRALHRLRERLPLGRPLTGVQVVAHGDEVLVREGSALWQADSGQGVFNFDVATLAARVAPIARRAARAAQRASPELLAEDWYELGCELELGAPEQARDAYRRALELDPHHAEARVNLGRLLQEAGQPAAAETHYRLALAARPDDAIAAFNLGVALEDLGRPDEAIAAYERALRADARIADAHYNLARLHERAGRKAAAIRHLKACRSLA